MESFVVMTANLAGPRGYGFPKRERATRHVFAECYPDIIGFQEFAESNWAVLGRTDLELVPAPRYESDFLGESEFMLPNPIAFNPDRFELLRSDMEWLHPDKKPEAAWGASTARSVSWAHFTERGTGRKVAVLNTQLDNVSPEARIKGVQELVTLANMATGFLGEESAVVVLGDANVSVASLNPRWATPEMRAPYELLLREGFTDAMMGTQPRRSTRLRTFHHYQGPGCGDDEWGTYDPDWIFVRNLKVENCTLLTKDYGGVWPSDHFWQLAYLQWQE